MNNYVLKPERRWVRLLAVAVGVLFFVGLSGCSILADPVTDCDTRAKPVTCQRDERFQLADTSIVVNEIENVAGPEDHAHVEAEITLKQKPAAKLNARLHVVDSLTQEVLVIDPEQAPVSAGDQTLTWDFSDQGYAQRIQFDRFPPNIFIIFDDGSEEITVSVMEVEYS